MVYSSTGICILSMSFKNGPVLLRHPIPMSNFIVSSLRTKLTTWRSVPPMWNVVINSSSLILFVFMPCPIGPDDVFRGDSETCEVIKMNVVSNGVKHRGDAERDETQLYRFADIKKS